MNMISKAEAVKMMKAAGIPSAVISYLKAHTPASVERADVEALIATNAQAVTA